MPNTSIYYTYLGTQSSMTDCAAFALLSLKVILHEKDEAESYFNFLAQRKAHVAEQGKAVAPPGLIRKIQRKNPDETIENTHFILNGRNIIPPIHYLHTQSKHALETYFREVDPQLATDDQKRIVMDFHNQGRRTFTPLFQCIPRFSPREANLSVRQEQIKILKETRDFLGQRIKQELYKKMV